MSAQTKSPDDTESGTPAWYQKLFEHAQGVALVLFLALFVLALGFLTFASRPDRPTTQASLDAGVVLQFGLSREAITRSLRIDLCPEGSESPYIECDEAAPADNARPAISTVTLESDLINESEEQFPIGQFTVSASNVGQTGLLVVVSANPSTPEDVPAGTYQGDLLIDRVGEDDPIPLELRASLADRDELPVALRVLLALGIGALAGTLLKWLDESFSPLATLRRRQRRVDHYLRTYSRQLPVGVVRRLEDVNSRIKSFDLEDVGPTLDEISKNQDALVAFASATQNLKTQLEQQKRLLGVEGLADIPEVASAIELEEARLQELCTEVVWPWEAADEVTVRLKKEKAKFRSFTLAMRRVAMLGQPEERDRLRKVADRILADEDEGDFFADIRVEAGSPHDTAAPPPRGPFNFELFAEAPSTDDLEPEERRTVGLWLLDNAWWLTLAVTALVVVFFGYQSQFLDEPRFEGDSLDYFSLALWALAIQLAGGTILETMGRLRTSRTGV